MFRARDRNCETSCRFFSLLLTASPGTKRSPAMKHLLLLLILRFGQIFLIPRRKRRNALHPAFLISAALSASKQGHAPAIANGAHSPLTGPLRAFRFIPFCLSVRWMRQPSALRPAALLAFHWWRAAANLLRGKPGCIQSILKSCAAPTPSSSSALRSGSLTKRILLFSRMPALCGCTAIWKPLSGFSRRCAHHTPGRIK